MIKIEDDGSGYSPRSTLLIAVACCIIRLRMSPTILRHGPYRFFFISREETRMDVHLMTPDGTAKFWLEPIVALADHYRLNPKELSRLEAIVRDR